MSEINETIEHKFYAEENLISVQCTQLEPFKLNVFHWCEHDDLLWCRYNSQILFKKNTFYRIWLCCTQMFLYTYRYHHPIMQSKKKNTEEFVFHTIRIYLGKTVDRFYSRVLPFVVAGYFIHSLFLRIALSISPHSFRHLTFHICRFIIWLCLSFHLPISYNITQIPTFLCET